MKRVRDHIANSKRLRKLKLFLISVRIRDKKVSLFRILVVFLEKLRSADVFDRAYGVAFNLTLSVFPAIIFFFALLAFLPVVDDVQTMAFLRDVIPSSVFQLIDHTIHDILSRPRGGLLSFGVIFALFLATSGMVSLMSAFNRIHYTIEKRSFLKTRAIATFLTLILAIVLVMAIALLVVGQLVINWIYHQNSMFEASTFYMIILLRFIIMFVFFYWQSLRCITWGHRSSSAGVFFLQAPYWQLSFAWQLPFCSRPTSPISDCTTKCTVPLAPSLP